MGHVRLPSGLWIPESLDSQRDPQKMYIDNILHVDYEISQFHMTMQDIMSNGIRDVANDFNISYNGNNVVTLDIGVAYTYGRRCEFYEPQNITIDLSLSAGGTRYWYMEVDFEHYDSDGSEGGPVIKVTHYDTEQPLHNATLYKITVPQGATEVNSGMVTDLRSLSPIEFKIPTSAL